MTAIKRARRVRYLLVVLVIAALVVMALWPSARRVDTAGIDRGSVRDTVDAEGRTRLRDR